ncbi:glycoside hydrolase [Clavulina sp. PMI_390]|nr:glycoside hydrolase [Clavulina sp. PMI_390]
MSGPRQRNTTPSVASRKGYDEPVHQLDDELEREKPAPKRSRKTFRIVTAGLILVAIAGLYVTITRGPLRKHTSFRDRVKYLIPTQEQAERNFAADVPRREMIKNAFLHAWHAYEEHAFGDDDFHPISKKGSNLTEAGGIGYTIVDALDTMMLMGLDDEVKRAREWIRDELTFDLDGEYNTFEITIRILGGLLGAYHMSSKTSSGPDALYLEKAQDIGDRILSAFSTPSGLPLPSFNPGQLIGIPDKHSPALVSTAEAATLQLELKYLSHLTGDDKYWRAGERVMKVLKAAGNGGLAPIMVNADIGQYVTSDIRLGSRGDSYYEYLLKQYLQTDRTEPAYRDMYDVAMEDINKHLVKYSPTNNLLYTSELQPQGGLQGSEWKNVPKQDHLVCFLGGSLLLGVTEGGGQVPPDLATFNEAEKRDWKTGIGLIRTCMETHNTWTGLSPEIAHFRTATDPEWIARYAPKDWYIKGMKGHEGDTYDARYMLRPETVESLYIGYRITGHSQFRTWGWQIFQAIQKHCKIQDGGYATVLNVDQMPVKHEDKMETFFLSETLKYLFLLFDRPGSISLEREVFNTEAHIFPVFTPEIESQI